jgi:hypothetical protein
VCCYESRSQRKRSPKKKKMRMKILAHRRGACKAR